MAQPPPIDPSFALPELNRLIQLAEMAGEPDVSIEGVRRRIALINRRAEDLVPELGELRQALVGMLDRLQMAQFSHDDRMPTIEVPSDVEAGQAQRLMQGERGSATFGSVSVHVKTRWVDHCGGDWWYLHPLMDGDGIIGLGDVSGHGMAAGMVAASLNATFRQVCRRKLEPDVVTQTMDRSCRELFQGTFLSSMVTVRWSEIFSTLTVCNAGHRVPYHLSAEGVRPIKAGKSLPLGAKANQRHQAFSVVLEPGDRVFLYTDGIMEAENRGGKEFGFRRLRKQLDQIRENNVSGLDVLRQLEAAMDGWADGVAIDDDVTLMVLERRPRPS